jgi:hypothetical protein
MNDQPNLELNSSPRQMGANPAKTILVAQSVLPCSVGGTSQMLYIGGGRP